MANPKNLKPYLNTAGGHKEYLFIGAERDEIDEERPSTKKKIYKYIYHPEKSEIKTYENLIKTPLKEIICDYYGSTEIDRKWYIILGNLEDEFENACDLKILDLKIGVHRVKDRELNKWNFKISGYIMNGGNVHKPESDSEVILRILREFLSNEKVRSGRCSNESLTLTDTDTDTEINKVILNKLIEKVKRIASLLKDNPMGNNFYESSLLIMHNSHKVVVKLIDFTHFGSGSFFQKYPDTASVSNPMQGIFDFIEVLEDLEGKAT